MTQTYMIDIHQYDKKIEDQKRLLEESAVSEENKKFIRDFIAFCEAGSEVNGSRTRLYLYTLRNIGLMVDKPFNKMNEDDIFALISKIKAKKSVKGKPYAPQTVEDYLKAISKFWRWLYFKRYHGEAPPSIKRVKTRMDAHDKEPEIYTKDEIQKIIHGATNVRDKAFFSCLYDLQCRVGELLTRRIKHISYDEDGDLQILIEPTKNGGSHTEPLFEATPFLTTWIRQHPRPDDPEAPLWTIMNKQGDVLPLQYPNIRKIFTLICKNQKLRVNQHNNIHMIRKSKATHDIADGVPIPYIEARGSWTKGSKVLHKCYILATQKDKKNAYKRKYNLPYNGIVETKELKKCDRCNAILDNGSKFCANCGFVVDKTLRNKAAEINKDITGLIDKDMLSEMIKKIVRESSEGRGGEVDGDKRHS